MDDERRQSIGATIRTLREARGQTRQDLASAAKISLEMLAKVEQGRKAPSAATLAALAAGLGLEAPDLAHRADAWQALASVGASLAALRAGTIAGTLGVGGAAAGLGPALLNPVGLAAVGGAYVVHRESRNRRHLEKFLASNLNRLSDDDLQDIADRLGNEIPREKT